MADIVLTIKKEEKGILIDALEQSFFYLNFGLLEAQAYPDSLKHQEDKISALNKLLDALKKTE